MMILKTILLLGLVQCQSILTMPRVELWSVCQCYKKQSIECFKDRAIESLNTMSRSVNWTLTGDFFNSGKTKLKRLRIDLTPLYNPNVKIMLDRQVFSNMINIEELILIEFRHMFELPDLKAATKLTRLTVRKGHLKRLDSAFCHSKPNLAELDLAFNEIEDLSHVLDECMSLSLLDLSNNRIKSLNGFFGPNSALVRVRMTYLFLISIYISVI